MTTSRECERAHARLVHMSLALLIVFALATTLPCIGLWVADERARRKAARPG